MPIIISVNDSNMRPVLAVDMTDGFAKMAAWILTNASKDSGWEIPPGATLTIAGGETRAIFPAESDPSAALQISCAVTKRPLLRVINGGKEEGAE